MNKGELAGRMEIKRERPHENEIKNNIYRKMTPACFVCHKRMGLWQERFDIKIENKENGIANSIDVCSEECANVVKEIGKFFENC